MSILEYINSDVFTPVYDNDVPLIRSPRIEAICKELYNAILNGEEIFLYGDYDMDGFCAVNVWIETLKVLYNVRPCVFRYRARTHALDQDIIRQAQESSASVVIINDTGSSIEDRQALSLLRSAGKTPIVIDHHLYQGDYLLDCESRLLFNSYEEKNILGAEVSGAYAALLIAKVLCDAHFGKALPFNAKVFALASMYSDCVSLSSDLGRALYNSVAMTKAPGPDFFVALNQWNYCYSRQFFSFIVAPKINGCFRTEQLQTLNSVFDATDRYRVRSVCSELVKIHEEAREIAALLTPKFTRERIGDITVCTHEVTDETRSMHIRNFTGVIATRVAEEEQSLCLTVVKDGRHYEGSVRDYYSRNVIDHFKLFCQAGGHSSAFGVMFADLQEVKRHLVMLNKYLSCEISKPYITINSTLIENDADINAIALYNEYMNTESSAVVSHVCTGVKLARSTMYNKYYQVGLPTSKLLMTKRTLLDGSTILIEPAICRGVELREKV